MIDENDLDDGNNDFITSHFEDEVNKDEEVQPKFDNKPNIMFIGREDYTEAQPDGAVVSLKRDLQPPDHIQNGMERIDLPSEDEQMEGPFFHEQADEIIQMFPTFYKRYV